MYITDLSSPCFEGHIGPCNKWHHLRQSLATTCTCLITVSHKSASPLFSSFFSSLCAYKSSSFLRTSLFSQFSSRSSFDVQTVFILRNTWHIHFQHLPWIILIVWFLLYFHIIADLISCLAFCYKFFRIYFWRNLTSFLLFVVVGGGGGFRVRTIK